jgi:HAD superfamily hydrolase (TIGR01484 family)
MTEKAENLFTKDVAHKILMIERGNLRLAVVMLSDIDGTVNDEAERESQRIQTIQPAKDAFEKLEQRGINIGLITARSFAEAEEYQKKLSVTGPIICEDGAVIALPNFVSSNQADKLSEFGRIKNHEGRIILMPKGDDEKPPITTIEIRELIKEIESSTKTEITSSCTNTPEELRAAANHASVEAAKLSQGRLASAYAVNLTDAQRNLVEELSGAKGIRTFTNPVDGITMFFPKGVNKGHAVDLLLKLMPILLPSREINGIFLIGVGNHNNDSPFLRRADMAIVVRKKDGSLAIESENVPQNAIVPTEPFGYGIKEAVPQILKSLEVV